MAGIITDTNLLSALAKQGIDKNRITLIQDYAKTVKGKSSPYAQIYADALSRQKFMVVQGLPMVDAYGFGHELEWKDKNGVIENGNNIFHAIVSNGAVRVVALSDQPTGAKRDDDVAYRPQLFVGGAEVRPKSLAPALLEADPLNENYHNNVLEWGYGFCRRRLRMIEGGIHGYWIFTQNPKGPVRIKYNQSGRFLLKLGEFGISGDEELIPADVFDQATYPLTIGDSLTFYPDAHTETSSVDGCVEHHQDDTAFATIRNGAGVAADDSSAGVIPVYIGSGTNVLWYAIRRGIYLFDTQGLPDSALIGAAIMSIRGYDKYDNFVPAIAGTYNVYSSAPASNTAIVAGDYDSLGTEAYCNSVITWAGYSTTNYNAWSFNATGIAAIAKAGVSKFGLREASYDVPNSAPTWSKNHGAGIYAYMSEQGTGYQPTLVVTYTVAIVKIGSEAIGVTESDIRRAYSRRSSAEAIGVTEGLIRRMYSKRFISEAVGLTEGLIKRGRSIRLINETIGRWIQKAVFKL